MNDVHAKVMQKVMAELSGLEPRIRHLLYVEPSLRDVSSKDFTQAYWRYVYGWREGDDLDGLAQPESIARIKRLVVQKEPWLGASREGRRIKSSKSEAIKQYVRGYRD